MLNLIKRTSSRQKPQPEPKRATQAPAAKQTEDAGKPVERQRMSRRRQTIAKRLVEVQHTAAMLTTFNEVDMTAVMNLRKRRKDQFLEQHDVKARIHVILYKSCCRRAEKISAPQRGNSRRRAL